MVEASFLSLAGGLTGILPAWKAATLDPVLAING